jgi:hypothetical protein
MSYLTENLQYAIFSNIILGLGKTLKKNSQDRFLAIQLSYIAVHNIQWWVVATPLSMTSASLQGMEVTRFLRHWELSILVPKAVCPLICFFENLIILLRLLKSISSLYLLASTGILAFQRTTAAVLTGQLFSSLSHYADWLDCAIE